MNRLAPAAAQALEGLRAFDLGSGPHPAEGYHGLDKVAYPPYVTACELASGIPWPIADGVATRLYSSHCIEHIDASYVETFRFVTSDRRPSHEPSPFLQSTGPQDALFWFFEEAWRVAAPGCEFRLRWPALTKVKDGSINTSAFQDPTHRRFIPPEQIHYFSVVGRERLRVAYPLTCNWIVKTAQQTEFEGGVFEDDMLLVKPEEAALPAQSAA